METQQPAGGAINSRKNWYATWWGIILILLFLPVFAIWYIWAKTKWNPVLKGLATLGVFIITIMALASGDAKDNNSDQRASQQTEQKPVVAETKSEAPAQQSENQIQPAQEVKNESNNQAPAEQAKPQTTQDKLWTALDKSEKTRTNYDISYDENKKEATLTFSPKDVWDENSVVRGSYAILVKYGKEAFQIDAVNSLTIDYKTQFTDRYGKQSMTDAVIITMTKDEFNKFDWENLKYQSVYNQIKSSASKYYVHPAMESKLDYSKLYLSY